MKQLSGLDSLFLFAESSRTPLEISSLQIYDPSTAPGGAVRFKDILQTFRQRLHGSRVFRRKLMTVPLSLDHPYWVEDGGFDVEYHVRHIALPAPGDWRQLMIQIARLQSRPLDKSRPLWEVYVIEGLDNVEGIKPGCFGLFMKMHHATLDGATGQGIMAAIHDFEPDPKPRAAMMPAEDAGAAGNAAWRLLAKSPLNNVSKSLKLAKGVAAALPGLLEASRGTGKAPRTLFNDGRVSANRVMDGRQFDLDEVKAIKQAVPGTTINDIVLTVIGGAMRKYLQAKAALPADPMIAGCPIDVRTEEDAHLDNMVSVMQASLCTDIDDPLARLKAVHIATQDAKAKTEAIGARTLAQIPMNLPAPLGKNLLPAALELATRFKIVPMNTIITNVAGIQRPIYLSGARMVSMLGMGPVMDNLGIFHAAFSYHGGISIMMTACRETVPDPAFYGECIAAAYEELKQAALPQRKAALATRLHRKPVRRKTAAR